MNFLTKPKNKWGWMRVIGYALVAVVALWTVLSALLQALGGVAWLRWTGYQSFTPTLGFELAILPLLAAMVGGWMEDQAVKFKAEQTTYHETQHALETRRKETLKRFHDAVLAQFPEAKHEAAGVAGQVHSSIPELIRATLPELDGKGKGELLHFLYEKGLVTGEAPLVELTGTDFARAISNKAHFNGICLDSVDLTNVEMDEAHLAKSRISGAKLSKAFLRKADLREAVLSRSNFKGARLDDANLEGADLTGARLEGAYLINANLLHCLVDDGFDRAAQPALGASLGALDAAVLVNTILPDGRKVTNAKGKEYLQKKELEEVVKRL